MKRLTSRRATVVLSAVVLSVAGLALPAAAAPPTNDSIDSATRLGAIPGKHVEDTSQATSTATDGRCVGGSSVWFRTRPTVTRTVRFSTLGSDYETVLAVFSGPKANRTPVACAYDSFDFDYGSARQVRLTAGTTYWIAVSACCRATRRGGQLVLNTSLPTAAGASVAVDTVETGTISGELLLSGTITCNTPSEYELDLSATERVSGSNVASGSGYTLGLCGPESTPWTFTVDSNTGWAFQAGTARVTDTEYVWDGFQFVDAGPHADNYGVTDNPNALKSRR